MATFNPRSAKLLRKGEHLLVEGCDGLRLVGNGNKKTWTRRFKVGGKMKQKAIGPWPKMQLHEAVAVWEAERTSAPERARAANIAPLNYTIHQLVDDYVTEHLKKNCTASVAAAGENMLKNVTLKLGNLTPAQLVRADAYAILDAKKDTPTIGAKIRSHMTAATNLALDSGRIPGDTANHWAGLMRGKLKSKGKLLGGVHVGRQRRSLNPDEVRTILHWIDNMHPLGRDCMIMYLWTCSRGGEFLAMRPEHISKEADGTWFTLQKSMTKNRKHEFATDYRIPIVGKALEVVQRRMTTDGWLFESKGKQYTQHSFSTYIYSLMPYSVKQGALKCPISNWTPHNLRRTSRTMLASIGCLKEVGEAVLGHLPPEIEATYNVHTYDKEKREWVTKLSAHLDLLGS